VCRNSVRMSVPSRPDDPLGRPGMAPKGRTRRPVGAAANARFRLGFRMPARCEQWYPGKGRRPAFFNRAAFGKSKFFSSAWVMFLRPGLRMEVRRAQRRSRLATGHHRRRLGLDGREHGATLDQIGTYTTSHRGHGSFRGLPLSAGQPQLGIGRLAPLCPKRDQLREECRNAGRAIAKPRPGRDAFPPALGET
jgi:hypothetical protein